MTTRTVTLAITTVHHLVSTLANEIERHRPLVGLPGGLTEAAFAALVADAETIRIASRGR